MFDVGDAMNLPYVDGSLDACRAETLLQHLTDPQQAVHEMTRVTRPGGRAATLESGTGTVLAGHASGGPSLTSGQPRVHSSQAGASLS